MKAKSLCTVLVAVIGLYAIFYAILMGLMPLSMAVVYLFVDGVQSDIVGGLALGVPQALVPGLLGYFLVVKASWISGKILFKHGEAAEESVSALSKEEFTYICISILGIYLFATTLPAAMQFAAAVMQAELNVYTSNPFIPTKEEFWAQGYHELIFHVVSVLFSAVVFFKSKSLARTLWLIRRAGV